MSARRFARLAAHLQDGVADAAWVQWRALGALAAAKHEPRSIVDPEALVLLSLWLRISEPRLWDFLTGFAAIGSRLLSVQRITTLAAAFPEGAGRELGRFAAAVTRARRDPRWRRLAQGHTAPSSRAGKVGEPSLVLPGALMLRLRAAFGVDVRTDVLACLLGRGGAWADVREMGSALGYARFSVRGACEALGNARLLEVADGRPLRLRADPDRWAAFLDESAIPPWRPWSSLFAVTIQLLLWMRGEGARAGSGRLASSLAREFLARHGAILRELRLQPAEADRPGADFLPLFERTVTGLSDWLRDNA